MCKLQDSGKKYDILGAAKTLRNASGDFEWKRRLYIAPDYTVKQRIIQQEAYEEFKRREEQGEQDIIIKQNLIFV